MQIHSIIDPRIESGTVQGQILFWNGTRWVHTEISELFWDDTAKQVTARGIIVTGGSVLGLNSVVFQPNANSITFLQVLDAAGASVLNLDSTNRQVTVGKTSAVYPFVIKSADASDQIEIYHDNTDAWMKWTDGKLLLQSDEGANVDTWVRFLGRGTGRALYQVATENFSGGVTVTATHTRATILAFGAGPVALDLQNLADKSIRMFQQASEGETQELQIYGFGTGFGGRENLNISVEKYAANTAEFMDVDNYMFGGNIITWNDTHSDADGARVTRHDFKGEQSGGEITTLARIEVGHDGTADDEKGYLDIFINDGNDGDSPTHIMRVDSVGVGIGTTEPDAKLEVVGTDAPITDFVRTSGSSNSLYLISTFTHQTSGDAQDGLGAGIKFRFTDNETTNNGLGFIGAERDGADTEGALILRAGTNGNDEFMRISSNGNVGIGTPDPGARLDVAGDMLFTGASSGLPFGEISVVGNSTETTITSQNVYVQVTIFDTNGENNNATPDHTNDHITIIKPGRYFMTCSITLNSIGGSGSTAEIEVKKNNGASRVGALHVDRTLAGGGAESGAITLTGFANLAVDDTIEVWVKNETNTQNYVVEDITLSLMQIGG